MKKLLTLTILFVITLTIGHISQSYAIDIDISESRAEILSTTEMKLWNVHAAGNAYWTHFRWNPAYNIFQVTDYGLGDIIFEENFNDGQLDGWYCCTSSSQWRIEDGVLISSWPINEPGYGALIYIGGLDLPESYEITFEAKLVVSGNTGWGTGSDHCLVILNLIDNNNYYQTGWRQNEYNDFPLWGTDIGEIGLVGVNAYNFDEYQWHTVKVVKNFGTISAYVNNDLMYTESVPSLSGGTIRLSASDGEFWIDNIIIRSLP